MPQGKYLFGMLTIFHFSQPVGITKTSENKTSEQEQKKDGRKAEKEATNKRRRKKTGSMDEI